MAASYKLNVKHQGTETGDFCVYQTNDTQAEDIRSLVWFKKRAHPETNLTFEWSIDYGFTWSEQGILMPGVVFEASQIVSTDPRDISKNSIGFTLVDNAFKFLPTNDHTTAGRLGITCDRTIPAEAASIGIAMSGNTAFACAATAGTKHTFKPHPRYWIAFGKFEEGEVIDLNRMTRKFEIVFKQNQYDKTLILTETNTWHEASI